MSIIEQAALAAAQAAGYSGLIDDPEQRKNLGPNEMDGDEWRDVARAVLAAIREPSETFVSAVSDFDSEGGYDTNAVNGEFEPNAARLWKAMIDAALSEQ